MLLGSIFSSWYWLDFLDNNEIAFLDDYFYYIGDFATVDGVIRLERY